MWLIFPCTGAQDPKPQTRFKRSPKSDKRNDPYQETISYLHKAIGFALRSAILYLRGCRSLERQYVVEDSKWNNRVTNILHKISLINAYSLLISCLKPSNLYIHLKSSSFLYLYVYLDLCFVSLSSSSCAL